MKIRKVEWGSNCAVLPITRTPIYGHLLGVLLRHQPLIAVLVKALP
jgi:hypothetical protein